MGQFISAVTLLVDDYDRAISFYVEALGFELVEDSDLGEGKRWVLVRPVSSDANSAQQSSILLAKATDEVQVANIGAQTGGRVAFFLKTDDFHNDYKRMKENGVTFMEEPRHEPYGHVVVFQDPFGNLWDLLEAL